jgi:hypothetical protein
MKAKSLYCVPVLTVALKMLRGVTRALPSFVEAPKGLLKSQAIDILVWFYATIFRRKNFIQYQYHRIDITFVAGLKKVFTRVLAMVVLWFLYMPREN